MSLYRSRSCANYVIVCMLQELDYKAAKSVGIKSLLLVRGDKSKEDIPKDTPAITNLEQVCSHLIS